MPTGFIAAYYNHYAYMVNPANGYFYDNGDDRCKQGYKGRDCSTSADEAMNVAAESTLQSELHVDPCLNSFGIASMCYHYARPQWFTDKFGGGMPGLFITYDQALVTQCVGFEGLNWGMNPLPGERGHIETSLGNGGGSVGFHSHATEMGYSRLDYHNLSYYAVLPGFLADMMPPLIDWAYLAELNQWLTDITKKPLRLGDKGSNVKTLNDLLVVKRWMPKPKKDKVYGDDTAAGVHHLKVATGIYPTDGHYFGGVAGKRLLRPKGL